MPFLYAFPSLVRALYKVEICQPNTGLSPKNEQNLDQSKELSSLSAQFLLWPYISTPRKMEILGLKQQKLLKGQSDMVQGEDRISKLPDVLLHHILYFVPTKRAVSTSTLSKRWRYVWNSVPSLDLREWRSSTTKDIHLETKRFINFMDRMLVHRDMSNIHKFSLSIDKHCNEFRVNEWISAAIMRKVEEISVFGTVPFTIPVSLFTCESITMLELKAPSDLNLPNSIHLPRLKILRLTVIKFTDEHLTEQLFSNCPVLEDLSLRCCTSCMDMEVLCISVPTLKYFLIDSFDGTVKINAPNLQSFKHFGIVANEYVLHSFPSLVDAEIRYRNKFGWGRAQESFCATKLVGGLSNVKHLIVSGETLEALSFADALLTNLHPFDNLIHLEVSSQFIYSTGEVLFALLRISPKLESLIFSQGTDTYLSVGDDGWTFNMMAPPCFVSHLKSVEFREFDGEPRELNIVKLFLRKAEVLERVAIFISACLSRNPKRKWIVKEQLLTTPRASTSCDIKFSSNV